AFGVVAVVEGARVPRIEPESIRLDRLDDRGGSEQCDEHDEHEHADAFQFAIHELTSCAGPVRMLSLTRRRRATMIQLATSDEPPAARKGVVRPVSGMTRVTPPTMMKTWS